MENSKERKWVSIALGVLQAFIGLGAVPSGLLLMLDSTGGGMGFSLDLLEGTPFQSYFIPGLFLMSVNGIGNLAGGVLNFIRYRFAGEISIGLGILLMGWIVIQVGLIGFVHWMQPMYFVLGLIEATLGLVLWNRKRRASVS